MADLAAVARVRVVGDIIESHTVPAGEAIGVGVPTRVDSSTFKGMIGNGSAAGEAGILGVNISPLVTAANIAAQVVKKGLLALYDASNANILAALAPGALVYLSNTDGRFADAAGTVAVIVGKVVVLWDQATPTKLLSVDL